MIGVMPRRRQVAFDMSGGGPSRVCAARGRSVTVWAAFRQPFCHIVQGRRVSLDAATRKPVLAVRYASALDLSRVSAVASAPRGPCTGCAQRSALIRGRL